MIRRALRWPFTGWRARLLLLLAAVIVAGLFALYASTGWGASLGADAAAIAARVGGARPGPRFENARPVTYPIERPGAWRAMLARTLDAPPDVEPTAPLEIARPSPGGALAVTWLGHSTVLVELDGVTLLTDPLLGARASPSSLVGPAPFHEAPLSPASLPPVDAVVISHDHYDHLDHAAVRALRATVARWIVPLGVGAHLVEWGVDDATITELAWWQVARVGAVKVVATPAHHSSGRRGAKENLTLWASFAFVGPEHRVYFGGDTGARAPFDDIGRRFGPFDLTLLPVGAYSTMWPSNHLTPEEAVAANHALIGAAVLPIHWGSFRLATHPWREPAERLRAAAKTPVVFPRPGETVRPPFGADPTPWWRAD